MSEAPNKRIAFKYAWSVDAAKYVKNSDIKITELKEDSPEVEYVFRRFTTLIKMTANKIQDIKEEYLESPYTPYILPITTIALSIIGDARLLNRWAVAESKITQINLLSEEPEIIRKILLDKFNWQAYYIEKTEKKTLVANTGMYYDWKLRFEDYLTANYSFHDAYWKLNNQIIHEGNVLLTHQIFTRLVSEKVKIELASRKLVKPDLKELDKSFINCVEKLKADWNELKKETGFHETQIQGPVRRESFPPCIQDLLGKMLAGENIPHQGRFTLTAFLLNIGMNESEIIELFKASPDFNEKLTRYQIEHIKGKDLNKPRYTPPSCKTLKTYGLCLNMDEICREIAHPLKYYNRMKRLVKKNR
ncbi:MAG: hypothetical protein OdinLCB4_003905 [Candidatus Odinarchaeum yellowstonii]|uniref:DNA primase large subunit PriL n=1 Tax=Odinarchaeota yellowstonii (strain LCB_4) TaxID=1841599 RepID=A0AAF0I9D5_ODILC|nr:MAG: hypothetical protein OdinLCB4_003905 [Candidatus Odinarchaeum yellowstonii]